MIGQAYSSLIDIKFKACNISHSMYCSSQASWYTIPIVNTSSSTTYFAMLIPLQTVSRLENWLWAATDRKSGILSLKLYPYFVEIVLTFMQIN